MPKIDLTDRFVAVVRAKSKTEYFDARTTGLGLRVSPSGVKAWSVMFDSPKDGNATSLASARGRAIEARGLVESGIDPRDGKAATGASMTPTSSSPTSKSILSRYALPAMLSAPCAWTLCR